LESNILSPQIKHRFGWVIHDAARLLARRFHAEIHQYGITVPQWRVIAQLVQTDQLSQIALARTVNSDQATVGDIVERLQANGLVTRVADPDDSRAKIVCLTEKARMIIDGMQPAADEIYVKAFGGINDVDRATMVSVLTRLIDNLSTATPTETSQLPQLRAKDR
jgi:MarR family transcriptional regulator for hemolysin